MKKGRGHATGLGLQYFDTVGWEIRRRQEEHVAWKNTFWYLACPIQCLMEEVE